MVLANGTFDGRQVVDPKALAACGHSADRVQSADRAGDAVGLLRLRVQRRDHVGGPHAFSHSGAFELGAGTNFVILPSADVAIVALTNATPSGVPETLTAEFADLVQFGEVREDWSTLYEKAFGAMEVPFGSLVGKQPPANPAPAAPLASYVGTYANDYWGPAPSPRRTAG